MSAVGAVFRRCGRSANRVSIEHTLEGRDRARIAVRITRRDTTIELEYRDDGPGHPEEAFQLEHHGVGLYLLQGLVRRNLRGDLSLHNEGGAVAVLRFPAEV